MEAWTMPKQIRQTGCKREKWDTMRDLGSLTWILSKYGTKVKAQNNQTQHTISSISVNSILICHNILSVDKHVD